MGSPLTWLKQHYFRDYWQNRTDCPPYFQYRHSLITDYWWNLHFQFSPNDLERYHIPSEDLNDPWIHWLHKTWYLHHIAIMIIVFLVSDFNTMLFATSLRAGAIILGHWYIGFASHKFGYAHYTITGADESGYNDLLLGLISFGEGFHNNHHSHPTSAKFSMKWYEIDTAWLLIWVLKKLNIIFEVNTMTETLKATARKHDKPKWTYPWKTTH
jgi:stearoyl-CoA desaturase (delta-9 desaturase)